MNNPIKYNLSISYSNEIRKITINVQTKINDIIKRSLDIFDIKITQTSGIYFYFIDANVYLGDNECIDFNNSYHDFIEEYEHEDNRLFVIEPILVSLRDRNSIENFRHKFMMYNQISTHNYYHRPIFNITNHFSDSNNRYNYLNDIPRTSNVNNTSEDDDVYFNFSMNQPTQNTYSTGFTGPTDNGSRSAAFNSTYSILQGLAGSFGSRLTTDVYQNTYNNILTSLNSILNPEQHVVLTQAQIDRLSSGTYSNLRQSGLILPECAQCNITLEEFTSDMQVTALPCMHAYQTNAIRYWLMNNCNRCPLCRAEVV